MMKTRSQTRVAIIGARGIGRHHANWWTREGARVCAFAGATPQSVAETGSMLRDTFGIEAAGYASVGAMLEAEKPDFVDICSPPPLHREHCLAALNAGCHVLCEKPFIFDPNLDRQRHLALASELADLAQTRGLLLGVSTQFTVAAHVFRQHWHDIHGHRAVKSYHGHLESPARDRGPGPARIWVDLSPHLISVMQEIFPDASIDWPTLETRFAGYEAIARFQLATASGGHAACELYTRNALQPPLNTRHFKLDGYAFEIEAAKDADGCYCAEVHTPSGAFQQPDFLRQVIREMLVGRPPADARTAIQNLDIMLHVLESACPIEKERRS